MSGNTESLSLKWGTLKGWKVQPGSPAHEALKRYHEEPTSLGSMTQHDTDVQKQALLELIDVVDCDEIYLDWDGRYVSKDEAKQYIKDYNS